MVLPGKRPGIGGGGAAGLDEAEVQALIDATPAAPIERAKRVMQWLVNAGASTRTAVGIATPTSSGTVTSTDDADGPWNNHATSITTNNPAGLVPSSYTTARPDWATEAIFTVKTESTPYADTRIGIGMVSGAGFDADSTPALSLALFRYATDIDGTAFWRCITDNGSGTPQTTTTAVAVAADTAYLMEIRFVGTTVEFYIGGGLVATHSTTIPSATTPLGPVIRVVNLAATARSIKWGRVAILHD